MSKRKLPLLQFIRNFPASYLFQAQILAVLGPVLGPITIYFTAKENLPTLRESVTRLLGDFQA